MQTNKTDDELQQLVEQILISEQIPAEATLHQSLNNYYLPLASWAAEQHQSTPLVIGINGSQGSGKTTLCKILSALLEHSFDKKVISLSIDDIYKTHAQRQELAESVHSLLATRGVPGTHDVELGCFVLEQIKERQPVDIPVFNKAIDDRLQKDDWIKIDHQVDIILFEGWCVGAIPEQESQLQTAINSLEEDEDQKRIWRTYVNHQLATDYQSLFSLIDKLVMLKIPDFNKAYQWRNLQEQKLRQTTDSDKNNKIMSGLEIERFIMHFERITQHMLKEMPERSDVTLNINADHQINELHIK